VDWENWDGTGIVKRHSSRGRIGKMEETFGGQGKGMRSADGDEEKRKEGRK
jgi:hypothetical protein